MTSELTLFSGLVLLSLGNDGVHCDGGFSRGTVTDDQLTLTTTDWDHGVDAHDTRLHWNGNGLTGDDARSKFFDRILSFTFDVALAIDRLAESIHDTTKKALADGNGEETACGADFVASLDASSGAEENATHFGFFKIESQAIDSAWKLDHFVEHDIAQTFDLGGTIADFTDDAHVGLRDGCLEAGDLGFDFLEDVTHRFGRLKTWD